MADRVVLHVGAMKSGTSYLQSLLFDQRDALAGDGVLVPGRVWADQARGVRQAVGASPKPHRPRWDELLDQVHAHAGTAVISMEYLGPCPEPVARRIVEELGAPATEVVLTVRDLNRSLVSMWQETVQNGRSWHWADYLDDARRLAPGRAGGRVDRSTPGGTFWRQQHVARIASTWAGVVGAEQVTVVTVPAPGASRSLLAERFAAATGLRLDAEAPVPVGNESLGLASILVLRRLNELLDDADFRFPHGSGVRKGVLAKEVLATRRAVEPVLGLAVEPWVREQTEATIAALEASAVAVVGTWTDLEPVAVAGVDPRDVDPADVNEAAIAGVAGLVLHAAR